MSIEDKSELRQYKNAVCRVYQTTDGETHATYRAATKHQSIVNVRMEVEYYVESMLPDFFDKNIKEDYIAQICAWESWRRSMKR